MHMHREGEVYTLNKDWVFRCTESPYTHMLEVWLLSNLCHAITCVHALPTSWALLDVELAEVVEGNDSVEIDYYTCHQYSH